MKKLILTTSLFGSMLLGSDISVNSVGINLGKSHSSYDQENLSGNIILGKTPDESFDSIEVYMTVNNLFERNDIKPYLSYNYSKNDDLKHQYVLLGLNKYYNPKDTKSVLYAGVLGGYGELRWKYDPLNSSKNTNVDAASFMAGIQLGMNYPLSSNVSLGLNGKYLFHDYETKLNPSTGVFSKINHEDTSVISLGLEYKF